MNKVCLVAGTETEGGDYSFADESKLWILMRAIHELYLRHPDRIQAYRVQCADLADLEDGETLYVIGHAGVAKVVNLDAEKMWQCFTSGRLPRNKRIKIQFLACLVGTYPSKKRGTWPKDTPSRRHGPDGSDLPDQGLFAIDLKKRLRQHAGYQCELFFATGPAMTLSAEGGDRAINWEKKLPEAVSENLFGDDSCSAIGAADWLSRDLPRNPMAFKPEIFKANEDAIAALQRCIAMEADTQRRSAPEIIKEAARRVSAVPAVSEFFKKWNALLLEYGLLYSPEESWVKVVP